MTDISCGCHMTVLSAKEKYIVTDARKLYSTVRLNSLSIICIVLSAFKLHWKLNIFNF
jgi:hypothetical protein